MRWPSLGLALLAAQAAADTSATITSAPSTTSSKSGSSSLDLAEATTITNGTVALPSGSYITYSTTVTLANGKSSVLVSTQTARNATLTSGNQTSVSTTSSDSITVLVGGGHTTTLTGNSTMNATTTATATATQAPVKNTRPCNGHPEYCSRSYSNISMVAAHNSPFVRKGNAAANQMLPVTTQLDDGIRMLQFESHYRNGTIMLCHTSCDLLNAGTLESYLTTVNQWVRDNPYDVVTILMVNSDYVDPGNYTTPVMNSGIMDLVYTPPKIPMALHDWPTLSDMIFANKRVVFFLDYQANQTAIPWLNDEFSQMWETPFSPTDRQFPCTEQRPPDLAPKDAKNRMYMANHNLNVELNLGSLSILIPNSAVINETNAVSGYGSLGRMADNCTAMWNRPPNFLLVDYYNEGNVPGSVFEVAAKMNNVTYNGKCCGLVSSALSMFSSAHLSTIFVISAGVFAFSSAF
ncbi:Uncharacterized protein PECH_002593 [Penicillium ucsense]|uniref:PLC-like phosphodiesterase n=1 Tax=Penicillium ucsense TaxID=2839758 RepID=A0A8J8WEK4_9EURO|nr:Uncharacterized protein PECM_002049 [Penicillium ucsense]KAF7730638.1 Uncharacterized protein PECH_002593 [Penicillium ucsense]